MNEQKRKNRKLRLLSFAMGVLLALPLFSFDAKAAQQTMERPTELIPLGQAIGVKLFADGVLVVGLSDGKSAAKEAGIKIGDVLLAFNGEEIDSTEKLREMLAENGEKCAAISLQRGSKSQTVSLLPEQNADGVYRLGAFIRDSMAGIGTMTFYDPQSEVFGALGHGVTDVDTGKLLPLGSGSVMDASVRAVQRGQSGKPGELRGEFDLTHDSGTLYANTNCGIFGRMKENEIDCSQAALPIASKNEVAIGGASILANVSGTEVKEYEIEIEKIFYSAGDTRNMLLHITDAELLDATGGIVQGMSGSPILQNGKIVGAVTHVLVDDATRGYGIFIENMLDTAFWTDETAKSA